MQLRVDTHWSLERQTRSWTLVGDRERHERIYDQHTHQVHLPRQLARLQLQVQQLIHRHEGIRRCRSCRGMYGPSEARAMGMAVPGHCGQCVGRMIVRR
jgi:hypothetical protein